jgi:hypothetical protein
MVIVQIRFRRLSKPFSHRTWCCVLVRARSLQQSLCQTLARAIRRSNRNSPSVYVPHASDVFVELLTTLS